jgi:hypothetical protein
LFRSVVAAVVRDSMLFYDVIVLVIPVFVDPQNAVLLDVAAKLLVEDEVGHLAVVKVDCGTLSNKKRRSINTLYFQVQG